MGFPLFAKKKWYNSSIKKVRQQKGGDKTRSCVKNNPENIIFMERV